MNYYEILKVKKDATQSQIKDSYKNLVKQYHPDVYDGDKSFAEYKTKEINVAYDILSNPELKREYDLSLEPKVEYTAPNIPYTKSTYENTKRNYTNYGKNYSDYYYEKSNPFYEYAKPYHDKFSENIVKKVDKLNIKSKLILLLIFILCYILFFLFSFLQLEQLNNKSRNNSINTNSIYNTYTPNTNSNTTENIYNVDSIFGEEYLKEYYYNNLDEGNFESYDDFKEQLEYYLNMYY